MDIDYVISEVGVTIANLERLKRGLEKERDSPPQDIKYNQELLEEPPRAVKPDPDKPAVVCNCGLPAAFKKSAPQNPKQWAAYFCARPPKDPKNCGFKKWLD